MDMGGTTGFSSMMKLANALKTYNAPQFGPPVGAAYSNPAMVQNNQIGMGAGLPLAPLASNQIGSSAMKPSMPGSPYNVYSSPMGTPVNLGNTVNSGAARVAVPVSPSGGPVVNPYSSLSRGMRGHGVLGDLVKLDMMEAADII